MRHALKGIKKRCAIVTALFVISQNVFSQNAYFQQEVNYRMNVTLNDEAHTISAFQQVQYINNSDSTIRFLYYHLWPNAYKNHKTALCEQLLSHGNTSLYFSKAFERGYIDSLDFKVNSTKVKWELDPKHIDICKIFLNEPLLPGDTIEITTPFFVKIPDAKFSRLGHIGQAYFITQWYPKPAVFDADGWHPMPYLDQGEFYSEFGNFDVKITLPDNYLLAATGDRIDARDEEDFLNLKVAQTLMRIKNVTSDENDMSFPASSKLTKTIRFKQNRVHDFAWFADKRFNVLRGQVELPGNKRKVDTWVFFTNQRFNVWSKAIDYVNASTLFYSRHVGDYPYNHVTAVDGTIMAGGGMEYPNITVIGDVDNDLELDMVIAHEVGHNWFYGILGSNERDVPALDEGINSLYEVRYIRERYPEHKLSAFFGKDSSFKLFDLDKIPVWRYHQVLFNASMRSRTDQAIGLGSEEFTSRNFGSIVYSKSSVVFDYLREYLGEEKFDKAMQSYFENWKFKHPGPSDLLAELSLQGSIDLSWFQNHLLISTDQVDYKIKSVKRQEDGTWEIKVKNKTASTVPFNIYAYKNGKLLGKIWFNGYRNTKTLSFPPADADYFMIDGNDLMPDINRKNNGMKTKGLFKKMEPLRLNFITSLDDGHKNRLNYCPIIGYNYYNGFMAGLSFYNYGIYAKRFEYSVSPFYAFATRTPAGFADFCLNTWPRSFIQKASVGVKIKTFAYDQVNFTDPAYEDHVLGFYKIAPYLRLELRKRRATSSIRQTIAYTSNNMFTDSIRYIKDGAVYNKKINTRSMVGELKYTFSNDRAIDPVKLNVSVQHTARMAKAFLELDYELTTSPAKYVDVRFFAGGFISGSLEDRASYAFRASGYNGWHDYLFETNHIGRNERNSPGFNQFTEKDGALKVWTPLGQTTEWMLALNLKSPRIYKTPFKIFGDVVMCDPRYLGNDQVLWDLGVDISLWKEIIEVYIPVLFTNQMRSALELNNVNDFKRIRFTFNIHKLEPKTIIQNDFF